MWELCNDTRNCFARNKRGGCLILKETYPAGVKCSFCKDEREVTKGKRFPVDKQYVDIHKGEAHARTMLI